MNKYIILLFSLLSAACVSAQGLSTHAGASSSVQMGQMAQDPTAQFHYVASPSLPHVTAPTVASPQASSTRRSSSLGRIFRFFGSSQQSSTNTSTPTTGGRIVGGSKNAQGISGITTQTPVISGIELLEVPITYGVDDGGGRPSGFGPGSDNRPGGGGNAGTPGKPGNSIPLSDGTSILLILAAFFAAFKVAHPSRDTE